MNNFTDLTPATRVFSGGPAQIQREVHTKFTATRKKEFAFRRVRQELRPEKIGAIRASLAVDNQPAMRKSK